MDLQIDLYWTAARGADPVTYLAGPMSGHQRAEVRCCTLSPDVRGAPAEYAGWQELQMTNPITLEEMARQAIDGDREALIGTKVTDEPVVLERDSTKRGYLHPVAGSDAGEVGAGLFAKRG